MAQYSRCGCQTECPCVLIGGKGIEVTGTGNPDDPYVISTDGTLDCALVTGCICSKIVGNTGIRCNAAGNIELFISGDAGNVMSFGQDGGLKAICEECTNLPENCARSVTDLEAKIAAKQFLWGTYQGGRLLVPWGTMRSIDHAVAVQSDIDVNWTSSLRGCAGAITPYPQFCSANWSGQFEYASADEAYCSSIWYYKLNPAQWMNFTKDVENYYDSGWDNRDADGGTLLSQIYGRVDQKLIQTLFISATNNYEQTIATIRYWCQQRRTILHHWIPDRLTAAVGAGIPAGIFSRPGTPTEESPWNGNFTPTLAAEAAAAGADWAAVSMRLTDAEIATFPAAGLKTMGMDTFRRTDVHRAVALGLVGLYSDDMVYQRYEETLNPLAGFIPHPNRNCFFPVDRTTWGSGSAGYGQCFPPENPTSFRFARGYLRTAGPPTNLINGIYLPCWHLPSNWGDYDPTAEDQDHLPSMLVGDISGHSFLDTPTGYRIAWYAGWVDANESNYGVNDPGVVANPPDTPASAIDKYGLFFAAPTDKNISGPNARADKGPAKAAEGYVVFIRPTNGSIVIGMRSPDGTTDGYTELAESGAQGPLIPANQLWRFEVHVTPGSISFRTDGGPDRASYRVDYTGEHVDRYRGPYVFLSKEELIGTEFEARYAEVDINPLTP